MACIIQGIVVIIIVYLLHTASDLSHILICDKTQSIDIISLVFAINVDLFEQVFKICYCDQFSAENAGISVHIYRICKKMFFRATKEVKGSPFG